MQIRAASGVLTGDNGAVLCVLRGRPPAAGEWSLPGGRVEPGESGSQAIVREFLEETGLVVAVGEFLGCTVVPGAAGTPGFVIDTHRVFAVSGTLQAGDDAAQVAWLPRDQLAALPTTSGLIEFLTGVGAFSGHDGLGQDARMWRPAMQTTELTKDTQLCISLAGRPSNIGTRFHNYLYGELGLDFVYKAFTTTDLPSAIAGIRALGIRGAGVSMPFKEEVIPLVDSLDDSARAIDSVNTVVNSDRHLRAYNTDYLAIASLLEQRQVPAELEFAVIGSGGMAKAVVAALRDRGHQAGVIVARNQDAGSALAERYGFTWLPALGGARPSLLINATPIGMAGGPQADDLPVPAEVVRAAETVFEVVAMPEATPLVRLARTMQRQVITGAEVIALQAAEQFALYTGVRPAAELVARASAFSRAGA